MKNPFYRIKLATGISYQETEANVVEFATATRHNKKALVAHIRNHYPNTYIRDIINGVYKAILLDDFLIGVQFDMNFITKKK